MSAATPGLLCAFHFFCPGFSKAQSMSAGWSKSLSLLLRDRIKTTGIVRRKKTERGGSPWQNQSAAQGPRVSPSHCRCVLGCVFLHACMCVLVSLCVCVSLCVFACVCIRVNICVCGLDFGLLVPGGPSNPLCNLDQKKGSQETYLTASGKVELLCGTHFKWVLF